jgi:glucose-1-phosphate cytidylyltransferase
MNEYLDAFLESDKVAAMLGVKPSQKSFHMISIGEESDVTDIKPVSQSDFWINGGYFILRKEIFDYLREGEELVEEPFGRLVEEQKLFAYQYSGFWSCMDTFKDKITFDRMNGSGETPWAVWKRG